MSSISVLHVGKYFPPFSGGMENFLADLLGALAHEDLNISAVVHDHRPTRKGEVSSWSAEGLDRPMLAGGVRSVSLYRVPTMGRLLYAPVSPQFPFWLRKAIRAERPDILHLHLPNTSAFWAMLLREARNIPWVIHWHADVVSSEVELRLKLGYPLYRPFEQKLLAGAGTVIVTSPGYLENSQALNPWRDKCDVIPLGLDSRRIPDISEQAYRRAESRWGDAGFRILSVGRLTYYKGHEYLIRAIKELPGTRALIVGEGACRPFLEKLISELAVSERVVLTGKLAATELHAVMATADCFCLPSIERTEAFGMVLLEAMAHGKAAIVCDILGSGMSWVVQDGETGHVVPPAEPSALVEAVRTLSADRETLSAMGAAGRRRYEELFRIDRVSGEMRELYRSVVERGTAE